MSKLFVTIFVFIGLIFPYASANRAPDAAPIKFTVLHTNDIHASAALGSLTMLGRLSAAITAARQALGPENVLLLDGGDFSDAIRCGQDDGFLVDEMFRLIGYNGFALGNHDFYCPLDEVYARSKNAGSAAFFASQLAYTNRDGACGWLPYLDAYQIYELGQEGRRVKVAVIGVAHFGAPTPKDVCQRSALEAVRYYYDQAKAEGGQVFILITHDRFDEPTPPPYGTGAAVLAQAMADEGRPFALVIGGHDHYLGKQMIGSTLLVEAGEHGHHLGIATLTFNPATGQTAASWTSKAIADTAPVDQRIQDLFDHYLDIPAFERRHILP